MALLACTPLDVLHARDAPTPPTPFSKVINTQHYTLTIDYEYNGMLLHTTWNELCFLYKDHDYFNPAIYETRALWRGVATTLPDGSAVYFQMRSDVCADSQLSRLVFGPDGHLALWRSFANAPSPLRASAEAADRDPSAYIMPVVYWLNNAKRPSRVELCVMPICSTKPGARVRVLGLHGATTESADTSNPSEAVPALASLTNGESRFVGYACWQIPFDEARRLMRLEGRALDTWGAGGGPGDAVADITFLVHEHLPLANAWAAVGDGFNYDQPAYNPVREWELEPAADRARLNTPMNSWRMNCRRDGDIIKFVSAAPPDMPIIMTHLSVGALSPTQIQLQSGQVLGAGPKSTKSGSEEPSWFTSEAVDKDRTTYIAEAIVFSANYAPPR